MFPNGTKVVGKSILKALTGDTAASPKRIDTVSGKMFLVLLVFKWFFLAVAELSDVSDYAIIRGGWFVMDLPPSHAGG
jgi:hypothetical protein